MPVKTSPRLIPAQFQPGVGVNLDSLPGALDIRTMPLSLFNQQKVGVSFKGLNLRQQQSLQMTGAERMPKPVPLQRRALREKHEPAVGEKSLFDDDQETMPYRIAARSALDSMLQDDSQRNREAITDALAQLHEPLQHFTVLFSALKEIEQRDDIAGRKKYKLKNAFNGMMTSLVNRDRGAIRRGLREGAEGSPVAAGIDAARAASGLSAGLRDLRFRVGARARGGVDEQLSAMVMTRSLLRTVGAAHTEEAMESVCSRLMNGLRTMSAIKQSAYVLTLSDAISFSIARTGFKIARDMKRELLLKAGVLCRLHHVEAGAILFTAAEHGWGKGKAAHLAAQLVDLTDVAPLVRAQSCQVIRSAADMMPMTAWPQEKLPSRIELLEDLDRQVLQAYAEIPLRTTRAEQMEENWRAMFAAGRAPILTVRA